ncbi:MAG TPA: VOC family protein [Trebonia sp.]
MERPARAGIMPEACRIVRFTLVVADMDRSEKFFVEALGFTVTDRIVGDSGFADLVGVPGVMTRQTHMRLGVQEVVLTAFDPPGRSYPPGSISSDLWFQHLAIIVADMDAALEQLRQASRIMPITEGGAVQLPCASGGVTAFKFRDADGHPFELLQFRPEATPEAWRGSSGSGAFLGIDHTAIAVAHTSRTVRFLGSFFGLVPTTRTENIGAEQARLDALPGAHVTVTSLNPRYSLPRVELLGYHTSRHYPIIMAASNDIAATHVVLQTENLDLIVATLQEDRARFASSGIATLWDGTRAVMVLDPDGHRFVIEQAPTASSALSPRH